MQEGAIGSDGLTCVLEFGLVLQELSKVGGDGLEPLLVPAGGQVGLEVRWDETLSSSTHLKENFPLLLFTASITPT